MPIYLSRLKSRLRYIVGFCIVAIVVVVVTGGPSPTPIQAQTSAPITCAQVLPAIQKSVTACKDLDRDQACYGNNSVSVVYQDSANQPAFAKVGDTVSLNQIKSISTAPLDLKTGVWGIAVLKLQAQNLDGTNVGQAVTFMSYGDTSVDIPSSTTGAAATPAATAAPLCTGTLSRSTYLRTAPQPAGPVVQLQNAKTTANITGKTADGAWVFAEVKSQTGWLLAKYVDMGCDAASLPTIDPTVPAEMPALRAFYFTTGVAEQAVCRDVPVGGLLIQSPSGRKVAFNANGVDITIGSTVLLNAPKGKPMTVGVVSGSADVTSQGQTTHLLGGQQLSVSLGDNGQQPNGPPSKPKPITASNNGNSLGLNTLCQTGQSFGVNVPCQVKLPFSPTAIPPTPEPPTAIP